MERRRAARNRRKLQQEKNPKKWRLTASVFIPLDAPPQKLLLLSLPKCARKVKNNSGEKKRRLVDGHVGPDGSSDGGAGAEGRRGG